MVRESLWSDMCTIISTSPSIHLYKTREFAASRHVIAQDTSSNQRTTFRSRERYVTHKTEIALAKGWLRAFDAPLLW